LCLWTGMPKLQQSLNIIELLAIHRTFKLELLTFSSYFGKIPTPFAPIQSSFLWVIRERQEATADLSTICQLLS